MEEEIKSLKQQLQENSDEDDQISSSSSSTSLSHPKPLQSKPTVRQQHKERVKERKMKRILSDGGMPTEYRKKKKEPVVEEGTNVFFVTKISRKTEPPPSFIEAISPIDNKQTRDLKENLEKCLFGKAQMTSSDQMLLKTLTTTDAGRRTVVTVLETIVNEVCCKKAKKIAQRFWF